MKHYFNIIRIVTSMDMGIGNRNKKWIFIDEDELVPGNQFEIFDNMLTIVSVDENEMEFNYMDQTFRVNRYWQVLGTPEFSLPDERISGQSRYIFFFTNDLDINSEWSDGHAGELVEQMNKNNENGDLWKNIPLVREFIHELKDVAPHRTDAINPIYKAYYLSCLLKNDYIDKRETPRLFQSLCELYRVYVDFGYNNDYDEFLKENFDKYYFREVDQYIYKFAWIVDNPEGKLALEYWNEIGGMLKVDPVQATPEWERVIYDVEKELDEKMKDEPRGMGFCFAYWSAKRAALARRGIEWRSPSAMNPRVMFD